jgi:hypothetical protein
VLNVGIAKKISLVNLPMVLDGKEIYHLLIDGHTFDRTTLVCG